MNNDDHRISPLDVRSRAKLVSSARILSLNEVVLELIKNALDAHARSIEVTLNYATGFCSVADNGFGIPASEFSKSGRLAQEYCTSKTIATKQVYGRHGQTLSRIAGVGLLCIISKASYSDGTHVLWCDEAGRIGDDAKGTEDIRACIGTTVKVYNLFSKMPVRSRYIGQTFANQHEIHKEFNKLRLLTLGLILSSAIPFEVDVKYHSLALRYHHRPTAVRSLRSIAQPYQSSEAICSSLRQAGFMREQRESEWCQVSIDSGSIKGIALISTVPLPHRDLQFISIDNKTLSKETRPEVFEHVNSLFNTSTFGSFESDFVSNVDTAEPISELDRQDRVKQRKRLKKIEQWPMFVIWLEGSDPVELSEILYARLLTRTVEALLDRVSSFLELMISEFLLQTGFSTSPTKLQKPRIDSSRANSFVDQRNDYIREAARQNFGHFSRLRSSAQTSNTDILGGLPFSHVSSGHTFTPFSRTQEDVVGADISDLNNISSSPPLWSDTKEQSMLWLDPATGRYLNVDLRTGMISPESVSSGTENPNDPVLPKSSRQQLTERPQTGASDRNIAQIARNVRKHFDNKGRAYDIPIRSIMVPAKSAGGVRLNQKSNFDQNGQSNHSSHSTDQDVRITKEALASIKFSTQVDKKFILAVVSLRRLEINVSEPEDDSLILIDQHAADERCKVESLLKSVQHGDSIYLQDSVHYEMPDAEFRRFLHVKPVLDRLRFVVEPSLKASIGVVGHEHELRQVEIKALPKAIAERCRSNPGLAIGILREVTWSEYTRSAALHDAKCTPSHVSSTTIFPELPPRMLDLINSRACRSAIMFNDELDDDQCRNLVHQLSECTLPFQCAHGRPSMIVVADMQQVTDPDSDLTTSSKLCEGSSTADSSRLFSWLLETYDRSGLNTVDSPNTPSFGDAYREWVRNDAC